MPEYVIEREIPGAGNLSDAELQEIARRSVSALKEMGPEIRWLHSYVTGDKVYCVYLSARRGNGSGTCAARRVPGESRLGGAADDGSQSGRVKESFGFRNNLAPLAVHCWHANP